MKERKYDIKKFLKENYKLIIPIALMIVLFLSFFVYYMVQKNNHYQVDTEEKVYQYFYDQKYEYKAIVSKNRKDVIVDLRPQDITINKDSTPIYYQDKEQVVFATDMSVVMPTLGCSEYLAKGYSYITFQDGIYKMTANRYHGKLNHYFLYDGGDLYFFIEEVTLKVGNEEIHLSPFSYVIARYNSYIAYYDRKNDMYRTIQTSEGDSVVENDYYTIYVSKDSIAYSGNDILLTSEIEHLNTIDQKG